MICHWEWALCQLSLSGNCRYGIWSALSILQYKRVGSSFSVHRFKVSFLISPVSPSLLCVCFWCALAKSICCSSVPRPKEEDLPMPMPMLYFASMIPSPGVYSTAHNFNLIASNLHRRRWSVSYLFGRQRQSKPTSRVFCFGFVSVSTEVLFYNRNDVSMFFLYFYHTVDKFARDLQSLEGGLYATTSSCEKKKFVERL